MDAGCKKKLSIVSNNKRNILIQGKGWNWSIANKGKKPQVMGHYINNYVYSRLAPNVLEELRIRNPKDERGNRKGKYPQWIDVDFGHPKLKEHLSILKAFAKASGYRWDTWIRMVERALPQFAKDGSQQLQIDFPVHEENVEGDFGEAIKKIARAGKPK